MALPPPDLASVFGFLKRHPDHMFMFTDQMAVLTFERDVGQVLYLIGNFDKERGMKYNTHVAMYAKEAQMN